MRASPHWSRASQQRICGPPYVAEDGLQGNLGNHGALGVCSWEEGFAWFSRNSQGRVLRGCSGGPESVLQLAERPDKSLMCSEPQFSQLWNGMDGNSHLASCLSLFKGAKCGMCSTLLRALSKCFTSECVPTKNHCFTLPPSPSCPHPTQHLGTARPACRPGSSYLSFSTGMAVENSLTSNVPRLQALMPS